MGNHSTAQLIMTVCAVIFSFFAIDCAIGITEAAQSRPAFFNFTGGMLAAGSAIAFAWFKEGLARPFR